MCMHIKVEFTVDRVEKLHEMHMQTDYYNSNKIHGCMYLIIAAKPNMLTLCQNAFKPAG